LRQEYSARPALATPCDASDCSSWPRPDATNRVRDEETLAKCAAFRLRNAGQKTVPLYLAEVAQQWEAPSVAVTDGTRLTRGGDRSDELLLTGQAMKASENWSSPKASDPEKAGPNMRGSKGDVPLPGQAVQWIAPMASDDGQKVTSVAHQKMLCNQAAAFLPPSSPDLPTAGGSMSSTDSPNSNQPSVKRKLNPIFVEALMRWPTGLSGFERQEMAWTRWWLLMPSFLSALYSASEPEEQMDLFGGLAA